jgi:hypothetical protein
MSFKDVLCPKGSIYKPAWQQVDLPFVDDVFPNIIEILQEKELLKYVLS